MKGMIAVALCFSLLGICMTTLVSHAKEGVAVVVVDVQGDFTTARNGSLAVPGSDRAYLDKVSKATQELKNLGIPVLATQDWHPANHMSFATNHSGKNPFDTIKLPDGRTQVLWPPHCVQASPGSEILLDSALINKVVKKGSDSKFDSYSGFKDDGGAITDLDKMLKEMGIKTIVVYGIATDFCVNATVLDGLKNGYKVYVVEELCRGVADDSSKKALKDMSENGAVIMTTLDLEKIRAL
ncbi:MAG: bifunctional nicotinamidase/pyrazinamidase [Syntrophaceae bacterium]|nr:bifunctional nicotinamidase/pyrazinamidase [Syntrophaceae bacterium]